MFESIFMYSLCSLSLVYSLPFFNISWAQYTEETTSLRPLVRPWCKPISSKKTTRSRDYFSIKKTNYTWDGLQVTLSGDEEGTYQLDPILDRFEPPWRHHLRLRSIPIQAQENDCSMGWCVPIEFELSEVTESEQTGLLLFTYMVRDQALQYNELGYLTLYSDFPGQGAYTRHRLSYDCSPFSCKLKAHHYDNSRGLSGSTQRTEMTTYFWTGNTATFSYTKEESTLLAWEIYGKDQRHGTVTVLPTGQILQLSMYDHDDRFIQESYEYDCNL